MESRPIAAQQPLPCERHQDHCDEPNHDIARQAGGAEIPTVDVVERGDESDSRSGIRRANCRAGSGRSQKYSTERPTPSRVLLPNLLTEWHLATSRLTCGPTYQPVGSALGSSAHWRSSCATSTASGRQRRRRSLWAKWFTRRRSANTGTGSSAFGWKAEASPAG